MSYSGEIKKEISNHYNNARHCIIAEVSAIITMCGKIKKTSKEGTVIIITSENIGVVRKCFTMIKKAFNISVDVSVKQNAYLKRGRTYTIIVRGDQAVGKLLQIIKIDENNLDAPSDNLVIMNSCCKRAFIRGAFLAAGSITNPQKSYHLEIVAPSFEKAQQIKYAINSFDIDSKVLERKSHYVVYIKEGSSIVDLLNVMEAHVALMNFENVRILKEMRNSINRQVNCETANITKTVTAAREQIEAIETIRKTIGLESLPEELEETALIRVDYPDASLIEIGKMLSKPIGKSGVNHRLRKIVAISQDISENKGIS